MAVRTYPMAAAVNSFEALTTFSFCGATILPGKQC
jgi:hypothetical protein